jgi:hypothetical protein
LDTAYIRVSDNQVLSALTLDLSVLTMSQWSKLLEASMSASDWEVCFQSIVSGDIPDWMMGDPKLKQDPDADENQSSQLLSPIGSKKKQAIFQIVPSLVSIWSSPKRISLEMRLKWRSRLSAMLKN